MERGRNGKRSSSPLLQVTPRRVAISRVNKWTLAFQIRLWRNGLIPLSLSVSLDLYKPPPWIIVRPSIKHTFSRKKNDSPVRSTSSSSPAANFYSSISARFIARHRINPSHQKRLLHTTAGDHGRQTNYIRGRLTKERERERKKNQAKRVTDTNGFRSNASANDDERGL